MKHTYEIKGNSKSPAPFIPIKIYNPCDINAAVKFTALLDTGSDSTFVPKKFLDIINVKPCGKGINFTGVNKSSKSKPYVISLELSDVKFEYHEIWVWNQTKDFALIGRDLINNFDIKFYGKQQLFDCLSCD